jgi:uncharacterized protein YciI
MATILSMLPPVLAATAATAAPQLPMETFPPPRATYFVALYDPGPAWVKGVPPGEQPGIKQHGAYMDELFRAGKLPLGGPLVGYTEQWEFGGALLVIDAESLEAARSLVAADPALETGVMTLKDLRLFLVYIGGVAPT